MENTGENCEMIGKIWKKDKLNSEMIWKIWKINESNSEDLENTEENSEKIGKIWKKRVKRYGKYRRKLWKDMKNMEEK